MSAARPFWSGWSRVTPVRPWPCAGWCR